MRLACSAVLALVSTATFLTAQANPCAVNLVPNGDFESLLFDPWQVSGNVTFPTGCSVDGITSSRCVSFASGLKSNFSVTQPTTFNLQSGSTYEVGFDLHVRTASCSNCVGSFSVGITENGNRTELLKAQVYSGRLRPIVQFTPTTTGAYSIDISAGNVRDVGIDNLYVRPATISFVLNGYSNIGRKIGKSNTFTVIGPAGRNFAVFLTASGQLPQPLPFSLCSGGWWLNFPAFQLVLGSLNAQGTFAGSFTMPNFGAGLPFDWQAVALPPGCAFGCPYTYAFF